MTIKPKKFLGIHSPSALWIAYLKGYSSLDDYEKEKVRGERKMTATEMTQLEDFINKIRAKLEETVYQECMYFKLNIYFPDERRRHLDNVWGALDYAYEAGIIYRDEYHNLLDAVIEAWKSDSTNKTPKTPKAKSAER